MSDPVLDRRTVPRAAAARPRVCVPEHGPDRDRPYLAGVEERAARLGVDLLPMTGTHHPRADGYLLIGGPWPPAGRRPVVPIGRRDGAAAYVEADYASAVTALVERARALGHERPAYLGPRSGAPERRGGNGRYRAFCEATADLPAIKLSPEDPAEVLVTTATVVFAEEHRHAEALARAARARGLRVPRDLSVVTLGDPHRPGSGLTGVRLPREELGRQALDLLVQLIRGGPAAPRLVPCLLADGSTLAPPARRRTTPLC